RLSGLEDRCLRPLAQGHTQAEGEGVEPSRLIAQPFSGRSPSPIGLPFRHPRAGLRPAAKRNCGGRNRTCNRLLNREPPYHSATPQIQSQKSEVRSQRSEVNSILAFLTPDF